MFKTPEYHICIRAICVNFYAGKPVQTFINWSKIICTIEFGLSFRVQERLVKKKCVIKLTQVTEHFSRCFKAPVQSEGVSGKDKGELG